MGVTAYKLKNGVKRWRADTRIKLPNGQEIRFVKHGIPTKEMAQRLIEKAQIETFEKGHFDRQRQGRITVAELWEKYEPVCKANNRGWDTDCARAAHLLRHLGDRKAEGLSIDDVTRYRAARKAETFGGGKVPSGSTINREVAQLRRLLNFGVEDSKLKRNPLSRIRGLITHEDNARDVWITEAEFSQLLKCADSDLKPILLVAYDTGMRKGEVLKLRWSQIEVRSKKTVFVRLSSADTKSKKPREFPLTARASAAIRSLPRSTSGFVFVNPETNQPWNQIQKKFHRARTAAGLAHIRFHDTRRSALTNGRRRGVPESVLMRISGHKTRSVFERYNIVSDDDLQQAVAVIQKGQRAEAKKAKRAKVGKDLVKNGVAGQNAAIEVAG